jgi:hypothetical protein
VGNDPRKLVGVEFRGCKLSHLVKSICVTAVDLNAESVSPVRAAVGWVSPDNVVGSVYGFFPDLESPQSFSGIACTSVSWKS